MIKDKIKLVLKLGQPDYDRIMNSDLSAYTFVQFHEKGKNLTMLGWTDLSL